MSEFDEDDDYGSASESGTEDDHDFKTRKTMNTGLSKKYAPFWVTRDAFREFYQNWRDGIVESFNIPPNLIKPIFVRDDHREVHITASLSLESSAGTGASQLLGYIIFKSRSGTLEMTNFKAKLERKHLSLGETKKQDQTRLAGGHGEGFKLAALTLVRNGHSVKFETNSLYWNFKFSPDDYPTLLCRFTKPEPQVIEKHWNKYLEQQRMDNFRRGLTAHIWEDTTVKIATGKDKRIVPKMISEQEFRAWLTVSLDLDPPEATGVVHTSTGDLIFDPRYRGRIYLKGLLVTEHGCGQGGKEYRFGYNFQNGSINRDRQRLANEHEEASMLAKIWEQAILLKGDAAIDAYVELFKADEEGPDIAKALTYVSRLMAKNISKHLKVSHPEAFFYSDREESEQNATTDEEIIVKELKRQPSKLPKKLWQIIRRHLYPDQPFMRTPLEERKCLFATSQPIDPDNNVFSANVVRALKGTFGLDQKLSNVRIEFVDGAETSLNLLYVEDQNLLQIHARWLNFTQVHNGSSCEIFLKVNEEQLMDNTAFLCDHVVQDLLEKVFEEVRVPLGLSHERATCLRGNAVEYLRQMPRAVKIAAPEAGNKLEVSWIGNETAIFIEKYGANIHYWVTLHNRISCEHRMREVLNIKGSEVSDDEDRSVEAGHINDSCTCPSQRVSRVDSRIVFNGLDHTKTYFPMVSRAKTPSFFGLPPSPLAPNEPSISSPRSSERFSEVESASSSDFHPVNIHSDSDKDTRVSGDEGGGGDSEMEILGAVSPIAMDEDKSSAAPTTPSTYVGNFGGQQREAPMPLRQRDQQNNGSNGALDSSILREDEKLWIEWHEKHLPQVFSQLIPTRKSSFQVYGDQVPELRYPELNYAFKRRQYAWVRIEGESSEQAIFVHNIFQHHYQSEVSFYLLVTRYSRLSSIFPFGTFPIAANPASDGNELILHFGDFDRMRTPEDAEMIELDDIVSVRLLDVGRIKVSHVFQQVPDHAEGLFCRFGICNNTTGGVASLTPLASHVLHEDNWAGPNFRNTATPLAIELSPGILGDSEGFSQAGFKIQAAFGIDEAKHNTWTNRHSTASLFDGAMTDVLDDINVRDRLLVNFPEPVPPKVLLVAGEHPWFRLNNRNQQMPTVQQFCVPLEEVSKAAAMLQLDPLEGAVEAVAKLKPDFFVILMSPAVLHPLARATFSECLLQLLKLRLSVHMKMFSVKDYGLPQERDVLAVVASPFCAPLPWESIHANRHGTGFQAAANLGDLIRNLAFENPRMGKGMNTGFVCSAPNPGGGGAGVSTLGHVYNHYTGIDVAQDQELMQVDDNAILTVVHGRKPWMHPGRKDMLTVRELARIQGIPDNLPFFGAIDLQYETVCKAIPPVIAKMVAQTIREAVRKSLPVTATTSRRNKRARTEGAGGDE